MFCFLRAAVMLNKNVFILAHQIGDRNFYPNYKKLIQSQWKPYFEQKNDQEKQLRHMLNSTYSNVPYYNKLFNEKLASSDIRTTEDIEIISILTKEFIRSNGGIF